MTDSRNEYVPSKVAGERGPGQEGVVVDIHHECIHQLITLYFTKILYFKEVITLYVTYTLDITTCNFKVGPYNRYILKARRTDSLIQRLGYFPVSPIKHNTVHSNNKFLSKSNRS